MKHLLMKNRRVVAIVKDTEIEFDEVYCVDEQNEEVYIRDVEIQNDIRLYDLYKAQKGLLTTVEIKNIRNKYDLSQKDFSLILGLGEVTINRIERGSIQTSSIDTIIRTAEALSEMEKILSRNGGKISNEVCQSTSKLIDQLKLNERHKVAYFVYEDLKPLEFRTERLLDISNEIIRKYNAKIDVKFKKYLENEEITKAEIEMNYITNLLLQKLLYYIQGLAGYVFEKRAFCEPIEAWEYGPVVPESYHHYKTNGRNPILKVEGEVYQLSKGVDALIDIVVEYYGNISASSLIDFTHEEDPWITTTLNSEIKFAKLIEYFSQIYR
jgi:uncharacterized phage-associated protein/DNA-binding transcriptional regulator YiaG